MGIYNTTHIKFKSLNYQFATNILKTATNLKLKNKTCKFCNQSDEDINHILFLCPALKTVRDEYIILANTLRNDQQEPDIDFSEDFIINMKNVKGPLEYDMISIFKQVIWNSTTKNRYENKNITPGCIIQQMYSNLDFFLSHIY